ncbi:aminotransferase class I/II-fold pyridoxal phosphate-dependent enzyme [Aliiglaciecola sp. 2_MG-2023]|uniref:aminotransferase class I/II-fold pyridoxal phosphate-dependent enzyme n=1 Tax=unclassified Aliiglaciecola TaxID=2593648 RepID=UPI0026E33FDE|nr:MULTISPECIES: aminotransferase class I/II-fold pyridoxal phosphate-dependent enzyme [unclassified Aliiglaciecola]MDO6712817.1 aminotransferase class I/II-fold pyridoxal phosphate-dependent enzyme [Aliiglaciecola sp. 2_MG-2023]MDO6753912.1 aminotransferase class I/II-fold pyridoxal phosphate-dependent enzyme [Aliiglaciecola sp. 1_MG-2023]
MQYSQRAQAISPFFAMAFGAKAAELEAQGHHIVKLNIGEPDFGAPPDVLRSMQTLATTAPLPYTSALGLPELRAAIAGFYKTAHNVDLNPNRVVVTAGASAALLLLSATFVDPGDNVIMGDPCYPCNRQFIKSFGGSVQLVPTQAQSRFQLNMALLEKHWQQGTRGLMLATPSNPTGTAVAPDELAAMCEFAKSRGAWRIIDEIYLNLHHGNVGTQPVTALSFDDEALVINSFSKYFGMTGWRLGWCVVPERAIPVMERMAQNYYICPSTLAQKAALACFTPASIAVCESRRETLKSRKELVLAGLKKCNLQVPVQPDGAFYVYIDVSRTGFTAMDFCERVLQDAHVALTPGNDFGEYQGDHFVRLSFASAESELEEGLQRLAGFMKKLMV